MDQDAPNRVPTELASSALPAGAATPTGDGPARIRLLLPLVTGLLGLTLALVGYLTPHHHPAAVMRRWQSAMARGDVDTLRHDERLGTGSWLVGLERELGNREYERVLAVYDRVDRVGAAEVQRLSERVTSGGQAAFQALPRDRQLEVLQQSHREWVMAQGLPRVPEALALGSWQVLLPPTAEPSLLQRLGASALSADEQTLLANRPDTHPEVVADPMLSALAARRRAQGAAMFAWIRQRVEREGEQAFRRETRTDREEIDQRSARAFVRQRGFAALSASDRARVGSLAALDDASGALRDRLGREGLEASEAREIEGKTRVEFVAQRTAYVSLTGARLAAVILREAFGSTRPEVERVVVSGVGGRDLLRRNAARIELAWPSRGDTLRQEPGALVLQWFPRKAAWHITGVEWRPRGQGAASAPVERPEATEQPTEGAGE
jgi:hypothetical protein